VEYHHSEIQYSNLNLLMSVLKDCIEGKISHNQKSQPLFRVCNDLVDVELSHYSLCGKNINRTLAAVTVITGEPEQTVKDRLKYNFQAIGTKAQIIGEQKLMMGRTIILDFTSYTYKELVTKEFISENFKYVSGRPIFQNPA